MDAADFELSVVDVGATPSRESFSSLCNFFCIVAGTTFRPSGAVFGPDIDLRSKSKKTFRELDVYNVTPNNHILNMVKGGRMIDFVAVNIIFVRQRTENLL